MSISLTLLNKQNALNASLSLGDNNTIFINEQSYIVSASYDEKGLLHLRTDMCDLLIEDTETIDEFKPNKNIVELVLDLNTGEAHPSSSVVYFYNKENSFIECYSTPIVSNELYSKVDTYLISGFNGEVSTASFINYLYQYASDIQHTLSVFIEECAKHGSLKAKLPTVQAYTSNYSFKLVRLGEASSEFGELITRFYLETKNCTPSFEISKNWDTVVLDDPSVDVFFMITEEPIPSTISVPSDKIVHTIQPGLISMGRSVIRKLNEIEKELKEKGIKSREKELASLKIDNESEGGCCGGSGKEGGCCKTEGESGGCCGGNKKKDCESSSVFECSEEDCCSKPKKVETTKSGCCKGKNTSDCCKSGGSECSCTDCGNKCS